MRVANHDQLRALVGGQERGSITLDKIEVVTQARNTLEAIHLVQLGARASLVCQLTGLTKNVVSRLYPLLSRNAIIARAGAIHRYVVLEKQSTYVARERSLASVPTS